MKYKQSKNGKDYVYEYKLIYIKPEVHKKLKKIKRYTHRSISDIIGVLLDHYEAQNK
jgi:predicted CopG family antitoxin